MQRRLRSFFVVFAVLGGLVLPGSALADPADTFHDSFLTFDCGDAVRAPGGVATVSGQAGENGVAASVSFWAGATDASGDPTLAGPAKDEVTGERNGNALHLEVGMFDVATGDPDGTAIIDATLAPTGRTTTDRHIDHFKGQRIQTTTASTPMAVTTGTLSVAGVDFDLAGCQGAAVVVDQRFISPDTFIAEASGTEMQCEIDQDGTHLSMFGAFDDQGVGFADVLVDPVGAGTADVSLVGGAIDATFPIQAIDTGETVATATLDATLTPTGATEVTALVAQTETFKATYALMSVAGSLVVEGVGSYDLSACQADAYQIRVVVHDPNGPKPGTRLAPNDTPAGAIHLTPGFEANVQSGATAAAAEQPASCMPPFGAIGHTLWYTVTGTGRTLTLDTAGSNFDTVIAVYARDGDAFTELDCVDDVPTGQVTRDIQARIAMPTAAGMTYWVQVGGFAGEYGRLRLSLT